MDKFYSIIEKNYHKFIDNNINIKPTLIQNSVKITTKKNNKECIEKTNNICIDPDRFLSIETIEGIDQKCDDMIVYQDRGNFLNKLYILSQGSTCFYDDKQVVFLIKIINIVLNSIESMFQSKNNTKFDLILFGSTSRKYFPCKTHDITANNVNSASTTFYGDDKITIRIYRKEELIKVMIHELIHVSGLERAISNNLQKIFNVSSDLLIGEAIVEALATFINCSIYSIMNNENINDIVKKEIEFGYLQTAKILDHFNFTSINDFLESKTKKINQTTAVFEYHILKTILLMKLDEFIIILQNKDSNKFKNLILQTIKDINYQKQIDYYINNIDLVPKNIMCTFRMTHIEIKFPIK